MKKEKCKNKEFEEKAKLKIHKLLNKIASKTLDSFSDKLVELFLISEEEECLEYVCEVLIESVFRKASCDKNYGELYCTLIKETLFHEDLEDECYDICLDAIHSQSIKCFQIVNEGNDAERAVDKKYYLNNCASFISILAHEKLLRVGDLTDVLKTLFETAGNEDKCVEIREVALEVSIKCLTFAKGLQNLRKRPFLDDLKQFKPIFSKRLQFLIADVLELYTKKNKRRN